MTLLTKTSLSLVENVEQLITAFLQNKKVVPLDAKLNQEVTVTDIDARQDNYAVYDTFLGKLEIQEDWTRDKDLQTSLPVFWKPEGGLYVFWRKQFDSLRDAVGAPQYQRLVVFYPFDRKLDYGEEVKPLTRLKVLPHKKILSYVEVDEKEDKQDRLCEYIDGMPLGKDPQGADSRITLLDFNVKHGDSFRKSSREEEFEYKLTAHLGGEIDVTLKNKFLFGAYENDAQGKQRWKTYYKWDDEHWQKEVALVQGILKMFTEPLLLL